MPRRLREWSVAAAPRALLLTHDAHEADAFARKSLDQALFLAAVADRAAGGVERVVSADSETMRPSQIAAMRSSLLTTRVAIADQIDQDIENLRRKRNQAGPETQLAAVRIEHIVFEQIAQVAAPGRTDCSRPS